jgi:small subunit ribosomal protein S21
MGDLFREGIFMVCFPTKVEEKKEEQECRMPLRMRVHDREPIGLALRRFKKLLERSGIQKELRKRKYYEKPCEARRRAELRKQSAIRKAKNQGTRPKS